MKTIHPSKLNGTIRMRPSKSVLHRALICAALARGESVIYNFAHSDDIDATLRCLRNMGFCQYDIDGDKCVMRGGFHHPVSQVLDCGESGSTMRFLIPLAFDGQEHVFTGKGRLMQRPMTIYENLFHGLHFVQNGDRLEIRGELLPDIYKLPGNISSQFISGLLFALPRLNGDSRIVLINQLESKSYVDLTCQMLKSFGIRVTERGNTYLIKGKQAYTARQVFAEGDYSHAAFFAAAAAMNGKVCMQGLNQNSLQGDKQILELLKIMGANVEWSDSDVCVRENSLRGVEIDVSQIPDLVPVLAVVACAAEGTTKLYNAQRLRLKESDRLYAMATELGKLGADIAEYEDSLLIRGTGMLGGGKVCTHNDHRIAMALSIASVIALKEIILDKPDVVAKSAPEFFSEFASLGGKVSE